MNLKILACSLFIMSLLGCASQSPDPMGTYASGQNTSGGGGSNNSGGTNPPPTQTTLARCNGFSGGQSLNGKIKIFQDPYGFYDSRQVRVRLSQMPANWASDDKLFIEFYRWRVVERSDAPGTFNVEQDPQPLRFRLEVPSTSQPATGYFGYDGTNNVGFNKTAFLAQTTQTNPNKLLDYNFLVTGTDLNLGYQVLRVALTRSDSGVSQNMGLADMLIPKFDVNPNRYAQTHPSTLNVLHPNWMRRNETWNDANFLAFTEQSCF